MIYLEINDEIENLFIINDLDLEMELASKSFNVYKVEKNHGEYVGDKDISTIIVATSVSIALLVKTILTIIKFFDDEPYYINFYEATEVLDENGKAILDERGNPIIKSKKIIIKYNSSEVNRSNDVLSILEPYKNIVTTLSKQ